MKKTYRIETVEDYCKPHGIELQHPLVNIVDFSTLKPRPTEYTHFYYGVYAIFIKDTDCGELLYGRNKYDYKERSLVFLQPGQILELVKNNTNHSKPKGWGLLFHPDLLLGTNLAKQMDDYSFFSYEVNEALHISEKERKMIMELFEKIHFEIDRPIDKHSRKLIVNNIQLFLDYCMRFYDRQFITREQMNKGILEKFETELNAYFKTDKAQRLGLPSVAYFADAVHLSPNYFGDLVKKETGKSAQEYIQLKLMNIAKNRILDVSKPISEIAYELGFSYPQHFTRMFKKSMGLSPSEYRRVN